MLKSKKTDIYVAEFAAAEREGIRTLWNWTFSKKFIFL